MTTSDILRPEMNESAFVSCPHCSEEVTADSDFCPHCGVLFAGAGPVACEEHAGKRAVGVCIMCHRLVCDECSTATMSRRFCRDHSLVEVRQDWAKVFGSSDINEAELAQALLEANGFHVQVLNASSIGFVWDGGGDSPISRSNISKPVKVFVPIPEYEKAVSVIEEWESGVGESTTELNP
ncbi:MAG: DUF2007 domain-containing protein [Ignavibacteriales bacterium]|nr:DUF2007 domain-containing protein [Ignavibacteriales bacterium]